jgi:predicted short-subunit dehydrogenase-like oxidoreductase (DUF2520 family)
LNKGLDPLGQVPEMTKITASSHLLLIGSGRLAKHLEFYFTEKQISFSLWNRRQTESELNRHLQAATHVLLAITDSALHSFISERLSGWKGTVTHFSGALNAQGAASAHPLMSFGPKLYSLADYEKIHFVISGAETLESLLPGLKNSYTLLSPQDKALYHALCVLGGNFPVLLWSKMTEGFRSLGLPPDAQQIYLEKIVENFNRYGAQALTGPLVRKDHSTIEMNLKALSGDPFQKVYSAFVEAYK